MKPNRWILLVCLATSFAWLFANCGSETMDGHCTNDNQCINGVCLDGACVECKSADDCPEGQDCVLQVCVPESCQGDLTCNNHGVCDDSGGTVVCTCEHGYGGDRCGDCADGFMDYGDGNCLPVDPCADYTGCDDLHRDCENDQGIPVCTGCLAGYHEENLACVEDRTCLETTCSGHGSCDDSSGAVVCTCGPEYAGDHCEGCAEGYTLWPTDSDICVDDPCIPDPCEQLPNALPDGCTQVGEDQFACSCEEGYLWDGGACAAACADQDGDQHGEGPACLGTDCDDGDPDVYEGAVESCDGKDNDCDEATDEELIPPDCTEPDQGVCAGATAARTCEGADGWSDCDYGLAYEASDEITCDGLDNDCDDATDEDLIPPDCAEPDHGVCAGATAARTCQGEAGWSACDYGSDYEPGEEVTCDTLDNDCDGEPDDPFDLPNNPEHCGECHYACEDHLPANAQVLGCQNGGCAYACLSDFGDCDSDLSLPDSNGCETYLPGNLQHCFGCNNDCTAGLTGINDQAACQAGGCFFSCDPGFTDCDNDLGNPGGTGCEADTNNDVHRCGDCSNDCTDDLTGNHDVASCDAGQCQYTCSGNFDDCDSDLGNPAGNGCETDVGSDTDHCGSCDFVCDLPHTDAHDCVDGDCEVVTCDTDYRNCNSTHPDGCEINIMSDPANCGACDYVCNLPHTDTHACAGGDCHVASCDPHFANCNAADNPDGCEVDLGASSNDCASADRMYESGGADHISGDDGNEETQTYTGRGGKWFFVDTTEDVGGIWGDPMEVRFELDAPGSADYNFCLYSACGTLLGCYEASGDDAACLCWGETGLFANGQDDDATFWIEVFHASGSGCGNWSLVVSGNQGCCS